MEPLTDEELTVLALAADPETSVDEDAVSLPDLLAAGGAPGLGLLPDWYMPAPGAGVPLLRGWRRQVGLLIIVSFVLINAYGLCSTYGWVGVG